ncbi:MAG TPA: dTMP kinase [Deltaproteobacteria bacterium]|nr:dTMP kinase [Deltaproteobacteria bacterium]
MKRFITFEGIEGSGKSTQISLAAEYLNKNNVPHLVTSEPSGTDIGRKIGDILFNRGNNHLSAEAELLLFCAARAQHVREVIIPALKGDNVVLCDRFSDATCAYQGAGRGLNSEHIKIINDYSAMNLKPDLTLLFDLPVEIGLKRAIKRNDSLKDSSFSDRFEREDIEFHSRVREAYLYIYKREPQRLRIIDATRDIEKVQDEVRGHLMSILNMK